MIEKLFFTGEINCPDFLIKITKSEDYLIEFKVYEDISHIVSCAKLEDKWKEGKYRVNKRVRLEASIKWDGCSHFNFIDEDIEDNGYFHFCGIGSVNQHSNLINSLYFLAKKYMKDFSDDVSDYKNMKYIPEIYEITENEIYFEEKE